MSMTLRFLCIYDWIEAFDFSQNPSFIVDSVRERCLTPTKAAFSVPGDRVRRRTLFKKSKLQDILAEFPVYDWGALDEPIDGEFLNVRSHVSFHCVDRTYLLAQSPEEFSVSDALEHLRLVCRAFKPRYGICALERGVAACVAPLGTPTTSMSTIERRRFSDLGDSLRRTKEHLAGKLHDVYPLNVLSAPHLACSVDGRSLHAWISEGSRGDLVSIDTDVHAWIVPDELRARVRDELFRSGSLIATV